MPTSAPGSSGARTLTSFAAPRGGSAGLGAPRRPAGRGRRFARSTDPARRARGFTLIELLVVLALIAIATAVASLALRDPAAAKLEQEAARLVALLESARAEARASGLAARWEPLAEQADGSGFRFVGLPATEPMPSRWLDPNTAAQVIGAAAIVLGPEPLIGEQRILLRLDNQRLVLATDGIGPFTVAEGGAPLP
jgi:general secretion pathway protein H